MKNSIMTAHEGMPTRRYSRLSLSTEVDGEPLLVVHVPFFDKGGRIVETKLSPRLEWWARQRMATEPADQIVDWWAAALASGANLMLARHNAVVDQRHLAYLTRLGAFSVVEAVKGPGPALDRLEWEVEHPPSVDIFASFLPAAVEWLSPESMTVVLTRAFEEALRVVDNFSQDEGVWNEIWLRFVYRFFQAVHSAAFWPRLATSSMVYATEELDKRIYSTIHSIATNGAGLLEEILNETSTLTAEATRQWQQPRDRKDNAIQSLSIFLAALLQRDSTRISGHRRLAIESDDAIRIRHTLTVSMRNV
jgi:hypothetical protein